MNKLHQHYAFTVDRGQQPVRIDKFLFDRIESTSRTRLQTAAKRGGLWANGKPVKASYRVRPGDQLAVMMEWERVEIEMIPQDIPLNIIYEDETLLIVNKQAGLVVHPGVGNHSGTLVNGLAYYFQGSSAFQQDDVRHGLVHRLDKDTTGLLVVAKTWDARIRLSEQFAQRTTLREYQALVWGRPKEDKGRIEGNIGRDLRDRKLMAVFPDGLQGKSAVTNYRLLEDLRYISLVSCRLETGRTHQIRAHFKHIGLPLFNDLDYGGDKILRGNLSSAYKHLVLRCFKMLQGQALHAKSLGFVHPATGEEVYFDSELPPEMQKVIQCWRNYVETL